MQSSRSSTGTRKTTQYINRDSQKYIERSSIGQTKRGNAAEKKDAAHIGGIGLFNAIHTHHPGAPLSVENKANVMKQLNRDDNLRIKSQYGNRVLDERRDARIASAVVEGHAIKGNTTIKRAVDAYEQFEKVKVAPSVARTMGNVAVALKDGTVTTVKDLASIQKR